MKPKVLSPKERRDADRARIKRATLRALKKAKQTADIEAARSERARTGTTGTASRELFRALREVLE